MGAWQGGGRGLRHQDLPRVGEMRAGLSGLGAWGWTVTQEGALILGLRRNTRESPWSEERNTVLPLIPQPEGERPT